MKYLQSVLFAAVLAFLICFSSPNSAQAQDDGTVPWCFPMRICPSQPSYAVDRSQDGGTVHLINYTPEQYGGSNQAPMLNNFSVSQSYSLLAGISFPAGDDAIERRLLFKDRHHGTYLIRRYLESAPAAYV